MKYFFDKALAFYIFKNYTPAQVTQQFDEMNKEFNAKKTRMNLFWQLSDSYLCLFVLYLGEMSIYSHVLLETGLINELLDELQDNSDLSAFSISSCLSGIGLLAHKISEPIPAEKVDALLFALCHKDYCAQDINKAIFAVSNLFTQNKIQGEINGRIIALLFDNLLFKNLNHKDIASIFYYLGQLGKTPLQLNETLAERILSGLVEKKASYTDCAQVAEGVALLCKNQAFTRHPKIESIESFMNYLCNAILEGYFVCAAFNMLQKIASYENFMFKISSSSMNHLILVLSCKAPSCDAIIQTLQSIEMLVKKGRYCDMIAGKHLNMLLQPLKDSRFLGELLPSALQSLTALYEHNAVDGWINPALLQQLLDRFKEKSLSPQRIAQVIMSLGKLSSYKNFCFTPSSNFIEVVTTKMSSGAPSPENIVKFMEGFATIKSYKNLYVNSKISKNLSIIFRLLITQQQKTLPSVLNRAILSLEKLALLGLAFEQELALLKAHYSTLEPDLIFSYESHNSSLKSCSFDWSDTLNTRNSVFFSMDITSDERLENFSKISYDF